MACTVISQGMPCAWCVCVCVSVTSQGNIFWFQSHQEKDAACVQHLHCSYVRHVLPGCPFWIPNLLRWGLVLLPAQPIVSLYVQLFKLSMHYFMHVCVYVAAWRGRSIKNYLNAFAPSSGRLAHCKSCLFRLSNYSNIVMILKHLVYDC